MTANSANWPGTCAACGGRFDVGDMIHRYDDGWAHANLEECE